jgi:hypothetical protein
MLIISYFKVLLILLCNSFSVFQQSSAINSRLLNLIIISFSLLLIIIKVSGVSGYISNPLNLTLLA